jgi:hypothetical protein
MVGGRLTTCPTACCCCNPIAPCTATVGLGPVSITATPPGGFYTESAPAIAGFRYCQSLSYFLMGGLEAWQSSAFIEKYDLSETQTTTYFLVVNGKTYVQTLQFSWEFCRRATLRFQDLRFRIYRSLTTNALKIVAFFETLDYRINTNAQWRRYDQTNAGPDGSCVFQPQIYSGNFPESCVFNGRPSFGYVENPITNRTNITIEANENDRFNCVDLWQPWTFNVNVQKSSIHPIYSIPNYNRNVTLGPGNLFRFAGSVNCLGPGNVIIGNYGWPVASTGTPVLSVTGLNVLTGAAAADPGTPENRTLTIQLNPC